MKKKSRQMKKDFDCRFDQGRIGINFEKGIATDGLSKIVKLPPMNIPLWLQKEIEEISKNQANSKAAVVRQLLVEAIQARKKAA